MTPQLRGHLPPLLPSALAHVARMSPEKIPSLISRGRLSGIIKQSHNNQAVAAIEAKIQEKGEKG